MEKLSNIIRKSADDSLYCMSLNYCDTSILPYVLNKNAKYLLINCHNPNPYFAWYNASLQIKESGELHSLKVRHVNFDIQIDTEDFIMMNAEFKEFGIDLLQFNKPIPNTLVYDIQKPQMNKILIQNGLFLKFYLPHKGETASICCTNREYLEGLLKLDIINNMF